MPEGFSTTPSAIRARDNGRIATTNVTNELVAALQSVGIADGHGPARGPRSLLIKLGDPHESLAGVFASGPIELAPKWDLASTTAGVFAVTDDEQMPRSDKPDFETDGTLIIDVAELVDTYLGYFANHNNGPAASDGQDVYLIDRSGVFPFLITSSTALGSNQWTYTGKRIRMKATPTSGAGGFGDVWEDHPDTPDDDATLYNSAELGNDGSTAAGVAIDDKFTGVEAITGIVFARAVSFPKVGDTAAGVAYWFDKANPPTLGC